MSLTPRLLTRVALALIGAGALWLHQLRASVHLGVPGVKLSSMPVMDEAFKVARSNSVALPMIVPGHSVKVNPISRLELDYLPPDTTYGRRTYTTQDGRFSAQASVVLMGTDRTSIHRPEYCLTGQGWNIEKKQAARVRIGGANPYELPVQRYDMRYTAQTGGQTSQRAGIYVFWFVADGQITESHVQRQWWLIRDLLSRRVLQRWAYVAFFTDCAPGDEDATFQKISTLIQSTVPEFQLTTGPRL